MERILCPAVFGCTIVVFAAREYRFSGVIKNESVYLVKKETTVSAISFLYGCYEVCFTLLKMRLTINTRAIALMSAGIM
jgi:hypothetical protein